MRPRRGDESGRKDRPELDANAVVSYNLRVIRERRGWTQLAAAERLGRLTGRQLPQASISAMEGAFDGRRRRRFDAHELYLLAEVFAVPIAYFFVPPPSEVTGDRVLADTDRSPNDLYAAFLGSDAELSALDERLALAAGREQDEALDAIHGTPTGGTSWLAHYRRWRVRRLHHLGRQWGFHLVEVAAVLSSFAEDLRALGPEAFLGGRADGPGEGLVESLDPALD